MKKKVTKLEEMAEQMDDFGSDEDEGAMSDMIDEEDVEANKLKRKKRPSKMCEKYVKYGKCKEREAYNEWKYNKDRFSKNTKTVNDC